MRINTLNTQNVPNSPLNNYKKAIPIIILILVLISLTRLDYFRNNFHSSWKSRETNNGNIKSSFISDNPNDVINESLEHKCDIFRGSWVWYPKGPYYTNESGCLIEEGEDCMKFGRPDTGYMKWRWKPDGCELPLFDAAEFLELVKGKSMAFVGDSVARNQMQSLGCLLSSVAHPIVESNPNDKRIRRWVYTEYNLTIQLFSTTHLVKAHGIEVMSVKPIELYVDEADDIWATQFHNFDYILISAGHWFSRPLTYYEKHKVVGCHMCNSNNVTDMTRYYGYRSAFKSAFRTILDSQKFKGTVILRTISPTHFEADEWEGRGNCVRKKPFTKQEMGSDWYLEMFHMIQMEEFRQAKREGKEKGVKFEVLDITEAMRLRPDGHPNHYGHPPEKKKGSDCLHWCLPGAVDLWNELLLQMLKNEGDGSFEV